MTIYSDMSHLLTVASLIICTTAFFLGLMTMGKKPSKKTILVRTPAAVVSRTEKVPVGLTKRTNENFFHLLLKTTTKKAFDSSNGKPGHDPNSRNTRSTERSGDNNVSTEHVIVASANKQHTEPTPLASNASVSGNKRTHEKIIDLGVAA